MPQMQPLRPCARCEQELPEAFFDGDGTIFCKRCTEELTEIIRSKYNLIEAAYYRAQLRRSSKRLKDRMNDVGGSKQVAGIQS